MLSEVFIASSSSPPKAAAINSSLLKDGGIFIHSYQPLQALRSTFKNSRTQTNCIAVSDSHVFAAQAGKATVHVYNREKGNQEALVAFPERITSLTLACKHSVLILGTEGGSIILWELYTGRQISTPALHLQAVTVLAVDGSDNFLVSGSLDSVIHVWSLLDLLSFHPAHGSFQHDPRVPKFTFSNHRAGITSLVIGHTGNFLNFVVSIANDQTAMVWRLHTGDLLRTYLLPAKPLCLVLDPADRAFFVGYEDGTIQLIDFFAFQSEIPRNVQDLTLAVTPIQPPPSSRWATPMEQIGAASCITISYDGTVILTGHFGGYVMAWEVGSRRFASMVADFSSAPITNLNFLPPSGFPNFPRPGMKVQNIVKPLPFEKFVSSSGQIPENYSLTVQFDSNLDVCSTYPSAKNKSDIHTALDGPTFPISLLQEGVLELSELASINSNTVKLNEQDFNADDFVKLDGIPKDHEHTEIKRLRDQVAHLKRVQEASFVQISNLQTERSELRKDVEEGSRRRLDKLRRREARAEREWTVLAEGSKEDDIGRPNGFHETSSCPSPSSREASSVE